MRDNMPPYRKAPSLRELWPWLKAAIALKMKSCAVEGLVAGRMELGQDEVGSEVQ